MGPEQATNAAGREPATARRAGLRRWGLAAAAVVLGLVAVLSAVESVLRLAPELFGEGAAYLALNRYDTRPGGMYVQERTTRARFMRANARMPAYARGYRWIHETDALGFRNPPSLERREVLLLGDSLIYGHGVESHHTVAHFLRTEHGVAAYDMSRQGNCLYDGYVLYRLYADELRPATVVVFVFFNDIADLLGRRRPHELADPPELNRFDYAEVRERVQRLQNQRLDLVTRTAFSLATVRYVDKYLHIRSRSRRAASKASPSPAAGVGWSAGAPAVGGSTQEPSPTKLRGAQRDGPPRAGVTTLKSGKVVTTGEGPKRRANAVLNEQRFLPAAGYYDRILGDLSDRCREAGTRLVVVQLFLNKPERGEADLLAQRKIRRVLAEIAHRRQLEFLDTEALFLGCEQCFLPVDGHFTELGHRRLAAFLADRMTRDVVGPAPH